MSQPTSQYNPIAKVIHWLSAIAIFGLFAVGYWMVDLSYYSEWYTVAPYWHKSIGLILFAMTAFRLIWKLLSKAPEIEGKNWEKAGAKIAHGLLYVLLFATFLSGYLISTADGRGIEVFNWFTFPGLGSLIENQEDIAGEVHFYLTYTLIALALLHAMAALKHHFINQDNTLKKMI
ncbi:cytochrome b [Psychromonas sp. psych-6C06]|uniref:cytochrome b n=1 Tax=Psychromonas sp. psych-6C06 TaxID=2058089 RepID=UPI000C331417|nr:cytochrome b [Psychromonas sp. psych-6C06]PKF62217.1 cytochrome b [Psychromonas sp. psych-6C06]